MHLTFDQFHATLEYKKLKPKQRIFVDRYLENGYDPIEAATFAGYQAKNSSTARNNAYILLRKIGIILALNTFFQDAPVKHFQAELWKLIQKKKIDENKLRALTLFAEVNGWRKSKNPHKTAIQTKPPENPPAVPAEPQGAEPTPQPSSLSQILSEFETDK